jgi:hypothetical protein
MDDPMVDEIRKVVEMAGPEDTVTLADLQVWRVCREPCACAIAVATSLPDLTPDILRRRLAVHEDVEHATIKIHHSLHAWNTTDIACEDGRGDAQDRAER